MPTSFITTTSTQFSYVAAYVTSWGREAAYGAPKYKDKFEYELSLERIQNIYAYELQISRLALFHSLMSEIINFLHITRFPTYL